MGKTHKNKSAGGLGVRYGRTIRKQLATIKQNLKTKQYCQRCGTQSVRRTSVGIWQCKKCGFTFSGAAYSPTSKMGEVARRSAKA
jgi:large subunit ribosomal protein L37Ae